MALSIHAQIPWEVSEIIPGGRFDAIVDLGEGKILAGTREPHPGIIVKSEDFGRSWREIGNITEKEEAIGKNSITCLANGGEGFVYMLTTNAEFWRSTDEGEHWTMITQLDDQLGEWAYSYGLWVTTEGTVLANTGSHIYRSTDKGLNFSKIGPLSEKPVYRFAWVGNGIIVNGWEGSVFKSEDDGLTWTTWTALDSTPLYAIEYMGDSMFIQASEAGNLYWGNAYVPNERKHLATLNGGADDFAYVGNQTLIYSTYTDEKNVYFSRDNGEHWVNTGKIPTQAEGDWLDHFISLNKADSVIVLGGTNKGYIVRAAYHKKELAKRQPKP